MVRIFWNFIFCLNIFVIHGRYYITMYLQIHKFIFDSSLAICFCRIKFYLFLLCVKITACGALISVSLAVQNQTLFESQVNEKFQAVRIVGILLYSIVLSITSTLALTYLFNLCNFLDTKYAPIFLDVSSVFLFRYLSKWNRKAFKFLLSILFLY